MYVLSTKGILSVASPTSCSASAVEFERQYGHRESELTSLELPETLMFNVTCVYKQNYLSKYNKKVSSWHISADFNPKHAPTSLSRLLCFRSLLIDAPIHTNSTTYIKMMNDKSLISLNSWDVYLASLTRAPNNFSIVREGHFFLPKNNIYTTVNRINKYSNKRP